MIRLLWYLLLLAAAAAGAAWLAGRPGAVTLDFGGGRVDTSAAFLVFAVVIVATVAAVSYRGWILARHAPRAIANARHSRRRANGYRALTSGMVAVAAGDARAAARYARRADALLSDPPLTMLLSAQAAQLGGDEQAAQKYFASMLESPETRFLGLRGLLMQAERRGDTARALALAENAYKARPKTPWVLTTLFELQAREGRWTAALDTLDAAVRAKHFDAADQRRLAPVLLLAASGEAEQAGEQSAAVDFARQAYRADPAFPPAQIRYASLLVREGKGRNASKIIQQGWSMMPHPDLVALYLEIDTAGDALKRVRRLEKLLSLNPGHRESHIALAQAAMDAKLWGAARTHLEKAAEDAPTGSICRLMAALEESEHGDTPEVREWLVRASTAPGDPAWMCGDCGAAHPDWAPLCGKCESFATLGWGTPASAPAAVPTPAASLPVRTEGP